MLCRWELLQLLFTQRFFWRASVVKKFNNRADQFRTEGFHDFWQRWTRFPGKWIVWTCCVDVLEHSSSTVKEMCRKDELEYSVEQTWRDDLKHSSEYSLSRLCSKKGIWSILVAHFVSAHQTNGDTILGIWSNGNLGGTDQTSTNSHTNSRTHSRLRGQEAGISQKYRSNLKPNGDKFESWNF